MDVCFRTFNTLSGSEVLSISGKTGSPRKSHCVTTSFLKHLRSISQLNPMAVQQIYYGSHLGASYMERSFVRRSGEECGTVFPFLDATEGAVEVMPVGIGSTHTVINIPNPVQSRVKLHHRDCIPHPKKNPV